MLGGESKREREVRADEGRGRMREKEMVWVLMEGKEESKVEREGDRARDGSDGFQIIQSHEGFPVDMNWMGVGRFL